MHFTMKHKLTDGVVVLFVAVKDINIEVFGLTALASRIDLMTVRSLQPGQTSGTGWRWREGKETSRGI